jgi:hypothetical protein
MVLAEKTITALERGTANTRWRDLSPIQATRHGTPTHGNGGNAHSTAWESMERDTIVRSLVDAKGIVLPDR